MGAANFGVGALGTAFTALMSNPILLILSAVASGGYLIYKNFDKIESKTIELWNSFKTNIGKVKDKTLELWDTFEKSLIFKVFEYSPLGMFLKGIKRIYDWYKKFKDEKGDENEINFSKNTNSQYRLNGRQGLNLNVPKHATGGIMTIHHLAIVGDAPETIVPHDGSEQSKNSWYHAGAKLGMFAGKGIPSLASNVEEKLSKTNIENKIEIKIDYNPIIQGSIDNITEILKNSSENLAKIVEEIVEKTIIKHGK